MFIINWDLKKKYFFFKKKFLLGGHVGLYKLRVEKSGYGNSIGDINFSYEIKVSGISPF